MVADRLCEMTAETHVPQDAPGARAVPTSAAGIVRDAIRASGGLGEPWCFDGVNAVRVGDVLFVIEVDDLGWMVTAYLIEGGEAAAVSV